MDHWGHCLWWSFPCSIRINTSYFSSCVAVNNSIWIDHRNNFEEIRVIEWTFNPMSFDHQLKQIRDDPLYHKAGGSLDRMLSTKYPNNFTIFNRFSTSSYCNNIKSLFPNSFTQLFNRKKRLIVLMIQNTIKIVKQLRIWIGIRWCEVNRILSISKLILKRKGIVWFISMISFYVILLVEYFYTTSVPTCSLLITFLWKY